MLSVALVNFSKMNLFLLFVYILLNHSYFNSKTNTIQAINLLKFPIIWSLAWR